MQHAPANREGPINPTSLANIPVQEEAAPPMGILGSQLRRKHALVADIQGAMAQIAEDPVFDSNGMAQWVPCAMFDLSQISHFFATFCTCFVFYLLT